MLSSIFSTAHPNVTDLWDLLYDFGVSNESRFIDHSGGEFDAMYFYGTKGASSILIHKYDIDGGFYERIFNTRGPWFSRSGL